MVSWRGSGSCAVAPRAGGCELTLHSCDVFIPAEVKKQPDVALTGLRERESEAKSVSASPSMMRRAL